MMEKNGVTVEFQYFCNKKMKVKYFDIISNQKISKYSCEFVYYILFKKSVS